MSIQIGVYDFFSYTIPGTFYLAAGYYLFRATGILDFSIDLSTISTASLIAYIVICTIISYILGFLMDAVAKNTWLRLFFLSDFKDRIESKYKKFGLPVRAEFDIEYAYVLYSIIKKKHPDVRTETEKYKAISIMLRNISFGLFLFSVSQIIQSVTTGGQPFYITLSIVLLVLSVVAGKQSVYFNIWFFSSIYQTLLSDVFALSTLYPIGKIDDDEEEDDDDDD